MVLLPQKNKLIFMHAFKLLQTKLLCMFCSPFEPFILVGLQQTMGLPYLKSIFVGNASLYSSCTFSFSHFCLVI